MELALYQPPGAWNFEVVARLLEKFYTPILWYKQIIFYPFYWYESHVFRRNRNCHSLPFTHNRLAVHIYEL